MPGSGPTHQPVAALAAAHRLLAPGGTVIVMDEAVAEKCRPPAGDTDSFTLRRAAHKLVTGPEQSVAD